MYTNHCIRLSLCLDRKFLLIGDLLLISYVTDGKYKFSTGASCNKFKSQTLKLKCMDKDLRANTLPEFSFMRWRHPSSWPAPADLCFLFPLFTSWKALERLTSPNVSRELLSKCSSPLQDRRRLSVCRGVRRGQSCLGEVLYVRLHSRHSQLSVPRLSELLKV